MSDEEVPDREVTDREEFGRKLLILDIDETLIISNNNEELYYDFEFTCFGSIHVNVKKRPYLSTFINNVSKHFDIAVWSAASSDYIDKIVKNIFFNKDLKFVWTREDCASIKCLCSDNPSECNLCYANGIIIYKPLERVFEKFNKYTRENTIIVDDNPLNFIKDEDNGIQIKLWDGNTNDNELEELEEYLLKHVVKMKNVTEYDHTAYTLNQ